MFRVLLVDDSKLMRAAVRDSLHSIEGVQVIAEAADGEAALARIILDRPDLVIMDVEMPRMDGLSVLQELRDRGLRVPVLMLSSLTQAGAEVTFRALELGALDFVGKPSPEANISADEAARRLIQRVSLFAEAHREAPHVSILRPRTQDRPVGAPAERGPDPKTTERTTPPLEPRTDCRLLVVAISTGGPMALARVLSDLGEALPIPMIIVQHMPPLFTSTLAERLDGVGPMRVSEATQHCELRPGHAVVVPGDLHLAVDQVNGVLRAVLNSDERVNGHRPSADVTMLSAVRLLGSATAGLIMTGMGRDGATGLMEIRKAGGPTLAQDAGTSAVYGMNRRAIEEGAVDWVLPLGEIAGALSTLLPAPGRQAAN